MPSVYDWSTTAGSNATADGGINWAEGQLPSTVNDSARTMMARVAEYIKDHGALTLSGTDTLTVTANSAFTTYATGRQIVAKVANTNTATTVTLNVNGIGAKRVKVVGSGGESDPEIGSIRAGQWAIFNYDAAANAAAGAWILLNPLQSATLTGAQPLDADLTAIAALSSAANKVPYSTGAQAWALADFTTTGRAIVAATVTADQILYGNGANTVTTATLTSAGRALLDDADASAQLTTLGVTAFAKTLLDDASASASRTTLELGTVAVEDTGTSGNVIPFLDGGNTHSGTNSFTGARNTFTGIFSFGPAVNHTITTGGTLTSITASHIALIGEGDTTDTLGTMPTSGPTVGDIAIMRFGGSTTYNVTIIDSTSISLVGGTSFVMDNPRDVIAFIYSGATWIELFRQNNT